MAKQVEVHPNFTAATEGQEPEVFVTWNHKSIEFGCKLAGLRIERQSLTAFALRDFLTHSSVCTEYVGHEKKGQLVNAELAYQGGGTD